MAYHIYQTEAFVLDERPFGEANKTFSLLTPDLGLVVAQAQGVRLLKSKLRFQIARYTLVRVSLVRGKEHWRLVGTERALDFGERDYGREKLELVVKIFSLLTHYIRGEGEQAGLFSELKQALLFLRTLDSSRAKDLLGFELALALRLLHLLGYIKDDSSLRSILSLADWNEEILTTALQHETKIVAAVNRARAESHF